jgi:hypothetical protein
MYLTFVPGNFTSVKSETVVVSHFRKLCSYRKKGCSNERCSIFFFVFSFSNLQSESTWPTACILLLETSSLIIWRDSFTRNVFLLNMFIGKKLFAYIIKTVSRQPGIIRKTWAGIQRQLLRYSLICDWTVL